MKKSNREAKKGLINVLENLLNTIKSDSWYVEEAKIDVENDIDEWARMVNFKDISISVKISPINYCTIGNVYVDLSDDNE